MVSIKGISALLLLYSFSRRTIAVILSLNSTLSRANGDTTVCRNTELWKTPQWTASVSYNCQRVIESLERLEPESLLAHVPFGHEFLPLGRVPEYPLVDAVRTPWKLTNGMIVCPLFLPHSFRRSSSLRPHVTIAKAIDRIGPCTMAVTTLAQIPLGYLPIEVGPGPFPDSGHSTWWFIRQRSLTLIDDCVEKGEGGIRWFRKLECSFPGPRGVFSY